MKKSYFSCLLLLTIAMANAQTGVPTVAARITQSAPVCNLGDTTNLTVDYTHISAPTDYTVARNPTFNSYPFSGGMNIPIPPQGQNNEDFWGPVFQLPFAFNFYGQTYQSIQPSSNGLITFNTTHNFGDFCDWIGSINETLPNATLYPNSIYGVYQDLDFTNRNGTSSINYYVLDNGINAAPNRVFVYNIDRLPNWPLDSASGLQTSQIVLHETTNIIEVNVLRRRPAVPWGGAGLIGIQNADTTKFVTPPGRNTGAWEATNESWIFTPSGAALPTTVTWSIGGNVVGNSETLTVHVTANTTAYTAAVDFTNADGIHTIVENQYNLQIGNLPQINQPQDLALCTTEAPFYTVDLTSNEAVVLGAEDPVNYEITYYTTLAAATNGFAFGRINTPTAYVFNGTQQTVYMRIEDLLGAGCHTVKPFQITVLAPATTPVGAPLQYFSIGQTLNDLIVTGNNVVWYDTETGGTILPGTNLLQNGFTYYAESANPNGCEGKMLAPRLAVTVQSLLAAQNFDEAFLKIYPNPVSNVLTVSYPEKLESIQIYNTVGQTVFAKNIGNTEVHADLSQLTAGVYFVNIIANNKIKTIKILKK